MSNLQNIWVASFELAQLSFIKKNQISSWTWLLGGIKVKGKDLTNVSERFDVLIFLHLKVYKQNVAKFSQSLTLSCLHS